MSRSFCWLAQKVQRTTGAVIKAIVMRAATYHAPLIKRKLDRSLTRRGFDAA